MKWFIIFCASILSLQELKAQCDIGETLVVQYTCDLVIGRPKYDCKKGFWFCWTNCRWEKKCIPEKADYLSGYVYAKILNEQFLEFHFPNKSLDKQNLTAEERAEFNVDDPLIFDFGKQKVQLITGDYPTVQKKEELVVQVPFKTL